MTEKNSKTPKLQNSKLLLLLGFVLLVGVALGQMFEVRVGPGKLIQSLRSKRSNLTESDSQKGSTFTYDDLARVVIPQEGKVVKVTWGDMGKKLIEAGAIDMDKFAQNFPALSAEEQRVLEGDDLAEIKFTEDNIYFWTDVLWALGLIQKGKVLTEGPIKQNEEQTPIKNYASTAGWTLGTKDAMQLYNSQMLIELTPEQDELVYKVSENIFRPCCGNSTAYPDCNHGMAVLGLLELMAAQGASEDDMYKAALAFNSYAFSSTYITTAAYMAEQGTVWADVDPKTALGQTYSSGQGAQFIAKQVGEIPGAPQKGSSCGA